MMYDLHLDLRDLMLIAIDILIVFIRILKFKSENRNSKNRRIQFILLGIMIILYTVTVMFKCIYKYILFIYNKYIHIVNTYNYIKITNYHVF